MRACSVGTRIFVFSVLMALAGYATAQQVYPNKPIRIIVPYPPGGTTIILAHLVGEKLTESWGQPAIVDSRPGAAGVVGSEALVRSPADGYTIMLTINAHVINPSLYGKLPFDAINDFAPVATLTKTEQLLVLNPSVPANNLREFIALAKSKPGQLNYASAGSGNPNHLAVELFNIMAGVKMQHVPYKGAGPALAAVFSGEVQLGFAPPPSAIPHIKSGKLKAMAISGETRSSALPQVPTFTEGGLPGFDVEYWSGVLAPAGTPRGIVDKLSTEIGKILAMPDVKEKLAIQGMDPFISTPDQFAALIKSDLVRFSKLIKAANIKLEN